MHLKIEKKLTVSNSFPTPRKDNDNDDDDYEDTLCIQHTFEAISDQGDATVDETTAAN